MLATGTPAAISGGGAAADGVTVSEAAAPANGKPQKIPKLEDAVVLGGEAMDTTDEVPKKVTRYNIARRVSFLP